MFIRTLVALLLIPTLAFAQALPSPRTAVRTDAAQAAPKAYIDQVLAGKANVADLGLANVTVNGTSGSLAAMLSGQVPIGGLRMRPAQGLGSALDIVQDPRTTPYAVTDPLLASLVLNNWVIGSASNPDGVPLTQGFAFGVGLNFRNYVGGPSMTGGREGFVFESAFVAPSSPTNQNRNYVPLATQMIVAAGDNGTALGATTSAGAFFALNPNIVAYSGATDLLEVTGGEVNTAMQAGSSTWIKNIWSLVGRHDDAVQGTAIDAMLLFGDQGGAVQWQNAMFIGGQNGRWPLSPTACVLCMGLADGAGNHGTIKSGIDFGNVNIVGGPAYRSSGFVVDGFGNVTMQSITANPDTADPHVVGRIYVDTSTHILKISTGP
jgi:hypothetical protein